MFALGVADFDNNGRDDVAVSAPWEDFPGASNGGAVYVREY